jgi:glycosyltransferase involved in cell wall biosynthesis
MKLLVLYRELAAYTVECLNKLANQASITLIHYPVNSEAPFEFKIDSRIEVFQKSNNSLSMIKSRSETYSHVLVGGWADEAYNQLAFHMNATRILAFDTPWENTLKFQIGSLYLRWKYARHYHYAFIPGESQRNLALRMGFKESKIKTGFYTATDEFQGTEKNTSITKELWCVARYIPQKNLHFLWKAYNDLAPNERSGWTLHCAGTGEGFSDRLNTEGIVHHGFLQPNDLAKHTENATAFVLPSLYEPWGVVVHEWTKLGKPLLLSTQVGASKDLLVENKNGFTFSPTNSLELKQALIKLFALSEYEIREMGKESHLLSLKFSSDLWMEQILSMN